MPYLLDERSSTRLGSVKNVFRTKFFRLPKPKDTSLPGFVANFFGLTRPGGPMAAAILAVVEDGILPPRMATLNAELTAKPAR